MHYNLQNNTVNWSRGVMVSTPNFEFGDRGFNSPRDQIIFENHRQLVP